MSCEELWKVLADLLTALRGRGETIPAEVMNDLRSAKTLIEILKAGPCGHKNLPRIERCLENVESYLLFLAHDSLESEHIEQWMRKLKRARSKVYEEGSMT